MTVLNELSQFEIELVRQCLTATVEGTFFPDWEFETLIGVDRKTVRIVRDAWPRQTVSSDEFDCAVMNSMNNLVGYPHGSTNELARFVSAELLIQPTLDHVAALLKELRKQDFA